MPSPTPGSNERTDLRSLLATPRIYSAFARLIGADAARREFVRRYARPQPGERVLDIGCGPGDLLEYLADVDYVGFDISDRYVEAARRKFGSRGHFFRAGVGEAGSLGPGRFDLAIAFGVLHHLADEEADRLLEEAISLLQPKGRLVTFDGCWAVGQSAIARWLLARDRGRHVRTAQELVGLAGRRFGHVEADLRHDLLRLPYSHVILICRA